MPWVSPPTGAAAAPSFVPSGFALPFALTTVIPGPEAGGAEPAVPTSLPPPPPVVPAAPPPDVVEAGPFAEPGRTLGAVPSAPPLAALGCEHFVHFGASHQPIPTPMSRT